jgi:hypothetical protein
VIAKIEVAAKIQTVRGEVLLQMADAFIVPSTTPDKVSIRQVGFCGLFSIFRIRATAALLLMGAPRPKWRDNGE